MPRKQISNPALKRGGSRRKEPHKKPEKEHCECCSRGRVRVKVPIRYMERSEGYIRALMAIHEFQKVGMESNIDTHKKLMEAIGDLSDKIPEGDYLKILELLQESYNKYDTLKNSTYVIRPNPSPCVSNILDQNSPILNNIVWASHPKSNTTMKIDSKISERAFPRITMMRE